MDPKFEPSDYGLCDRLPKSYKEYLSMAATPPLTIPPTVPDSLALESALGTIPLDTAYLDSAANVVEVVSMGTAHRDGIATSHLTLLETGEETSQQAVH